MTDFKYFFITLLILIGSIKYGNSISCYECNSYSNKNCSSSNKDILPALDCTNLENSKSVKYTMCRKTVQVIEFDQNGLPANTRVIRACAWADPQYKDSCYHRSEFGTQQDTCYCSGNLCNSSSKIYTCSQLFISAGFVLLFSLRKTLFFI